MASIKFEPIEIELRNGTKFDLGMCAKVVLTKKVDHIDIIECTIPALNIDINSITDSPNVYFILGNKKYILLDVENIK